MSNSYVITGKRLLIISVAFTLVLILAAWLILIFFQHKSINAAFISGTPLYTELAAGLIYGTIAGLICLFMLLNYRVFNDMLELLRDIIGTVKFTYSLACFLSLAAGVSEELLFRAGIQPFLGLWWTSLLFVGLHGYFNPRNLRISLYGLLMLALTLGLGLLYRYVGLTSAICAHAVFDMVVLSGIIKTMPG